MKAPFFKFSPSDWLAGIIQSVGFAERGIFIELCARIWNGSEVRRGDKLARLLRIDREELDAALDELAALDIITIDEDGTIGVKFLAEQREEIDEVSAIRAEMGRRGGLAKASKGKQEPSKPKQTEAKAKQNVAIKEKEKEEDKNKRETLLTEGKEKVAAEADAFSAAAAEKESFVESSLKPTTDFGRWSEEQFRRSVSDAVVKHPEYKSAVDAFSRYWLEPDKRGRYRFALEKTWSTAGRLATWYLREVQRGNIQQNTTGYRVNRDGVVRGTSDEAEIEATRKYRGGF